MSTVSDLIHSSFRLIGAIAAGELLETDELNDAFVSLNQMIASWNTEGVSLVARQRLSIPVNNSSNSYFLPTRPVRIESASVSTLGVLDSPLKIVDSVGWEAVPEKQAQSVYVNTLFCDYGYPTATVYIAPQPRMAASLELWIYVIMPQFLTVSDVIDLPPGYEMALRYNFAVALLPEYPRSAADPSLPAQAQMYKASIAQLNTTNHIRSQTSSPAQTAMTDATQTAVR